MNHRKKTPNLSLSSFAVLILAGLIVAVGGVSYVVVKNKQVTLRKEIARSEGRKHEHQIAITEHQADIEETLGVFHLRERLVTSRSNLERIPAGVIEKCRAPEFAEAPNHAVAAR